jgi:SAM-dependent methyltransferase
VSEDLDALYAQRFPPEVTAARRAVWHEIVRYLQRFVVPGAVLDIACGEGYFIRHVRARERWATDTRDVSADLPSGVQFVRADGLDLREVLPAGHFDTVFMSNYLEHLPTRAAVVEQLETARDLLSPGGRVMVLQPNIRLVGGHYWDQLDHHVALTEETLREAAAVAGLREVRTIVRFLPYTTKSRLPQHPLLVRAYLAFPPAWRIMGKQTLFIAERA